MISVDIRAKEEQVQIHRRLHVNPTHSVLTLCSPLTQTGVKPLKKGRSEDNGASHCSHGRVIIIDSITASVILSTKLPQSPYHIVIVTAGSRLISAYDDIT